MALEKHVGTFTTPTTTGNVAYTGVGFVPKLILFFGTGATGFAANYRRSWGVTAGTGATDEWAGSGGCDDNLSVTNTFKQFNTGVCILNSRTGTAKDVASLVSFDADGFTLSWSTVHTGGIQMFYMALGGDISVDVGTLSLTASTTGNFSKTGVGFQPKLLMGYMGYKAADANFADTEQCSYGIATSSTARGVISAYSEDNLSSASNAERYHNSTAFIAAPDGSLAKDNEVDFVSQDADGFTVNVSNALSSTRPMGYIAIGGNVQAHVGNFTQKTTNGSDAITGVGFQPEIDFFMTSQYPSDGNVKNDAHISVGFGINSTNRRSNANADKDAEATSDSHRRSETTKCLGLVSNAGGNLGEADLTTQDSDGFTLNWTNVDGTARTIYYWSLAASAAAGDLLLTNRSIANFGGMR